MNIFFGIFVGLIVLTILVVLHELGHFMMAKKNGVKVNEFGIGFPPRAIAWIHLPESQIKNYINKLPPEVRQKISLKKFDKYLKSKKTSTKNNKEKKLNSKKQDNVTKVMSKEKYFWIRFPKSEYEIPQEYLIFSLNFLPIGGFCAMDGESASDTKKGTFGATNFWQKTQILFGGVLMNWLTAIIIFTILAWTGLPSFLPNQFTIQNDMKKEKQPVIVEKVLENSPAHKANIKVHSQILSIEDQTQTSSTAKVTEVFDTDTVMSFNSAHRGQTVKYNLLDQDQKPYQATVTLNSNGEGSPALGIAMNSTRQSLARYTWSAPLVGIGTTIQLTGETFKGLSLLVSNFTQGIINQFSSNNSLKEKGKQQINEVSNSVSGPVGIIGVLFPAFTSTGLTNLAFLAAVISISLACMNVLPIPALDGGRFILIGLFKIRRKKLEKQLEEKIVGGAFLFLIALSILVTVLDIVKITK